MTIAAILGIDVTAQSTTPEFIPGQLGAVTDSTGTKLYKYLKYDDGTAAVDGVAGEVAYYYTLDGYKNHVCTSDLSDSIEIGAGVIQANIGPSIIQMNTEVQKPSDIIRLSVMDQNFNTTNPLLE